MQHTAMIAMQSAQSASERARETGRRYAVFENTGFFRTSMHDTFLFTHRASIEKARHPYRTAAFRKVTIAARALLELRLNLARLQLLHTAQLVEHERQGRENCQAVSDRHGKIHRIQACVLREQRRQHVRKRQIERNQEDDLAVNERKTDFAGWPVAWK